MNKRLIFCLAICLLPLLGQQVNFPKCAKACRSGGAAHPMKYQQFKGIPLLACSASFPAAAPPRANWDIPLNLDLSQTSGLRIRLLVFNPQLSGQCTIQLRTSGQWHSTTLRLPPHNQWAEFFISKAEFISENSPIPSWKQAEMLRIYIQDAIPGNLTLFIGKLEFVSPNTSLALLQFNGGASNLPGIARSLTTQGIYPAVITQSDLSHQLLRPYRLVMVPELPAHALSKLTDYSRCGGKLGLFHQIPVQLANSLGWPAAQELQGITFEGITPAPHKLPGYQPIKDKITAAMRLRSLPVDAEILAWLIAENEETPPCPAAFVNAQGFWIPCQIPFQSPITEGALLRALIAPFIPDIHRIGAQTLLQELRLFIPFQTAGQLTDDITQTQQQLTIADQAFNRRRYNKTIHLCQEMTRKWPKK